MRINASRRHLQLKNRVQRNSYEETTYQGLVSPDKDLSRHQLFDALLPMICSEVESDGSRTDVRPAFVRLANVRPQMFVRICSSAQKFVSHMFVSHLFVWTNIRPAFVRLYICSSTQMFVSLMFVRAFIRPRNCSSTQLFVHKLFVYKLFV